MRLWYLSNRRQAKAQATLRIRAVSPEPSLFAHMNYGDKCLSAFANKNEVMAHTSAYIEMSRIMTKPTKWLVRQAKTQISLGVAQSSDQRLRCPHEDSLGP